MHKGIHGVMVTVLRNEHDDPCSNPGRDCIYFI